MKNEIAFEMAASNIRFGPGVTREVGLDLAELGARKVLVVTDPVLADMAPLRPCWSRSIAPALVLSCTIGCE